MSEERLDRIEDMLTQLIGMVGNVVKEQQLAKEEIKTVKQDVSELKSDVSVLKSDVSGLKSEMGRMNERIGRIEEQHSTYFETQKYMLDKLADHDHDIHVLKQRLLKT